MRATYSKYYMWSAGALVGNGVVITHWTRLEHLDPIVLVAGILMTLIGMRLKP